MSLSTLCFLSAREMDPKRKSAANMRVSYTVSIGNSLSSCIMYADVLLTRLGFISAPSSDTLPFRLPLAILPASPSRNVDLPAPLGPITAVTHPFGAYPVIRCSKSTSCVTHFPSTFCFFVTVYVRPENSSPPVKFGTFGMSIT